MGMGSGFIGPGAGTAFYYTLFDVGAVILFHLLPRTLVGTMLLKLVTLRAINEAQGCMEWQRGRDYRLWPCASTIDDRVLDRPRRLTQSQTRRRRERHRQPHQRPPQPDFPPGDGLN
jgi:hypothetical protein